MSTARVTTLALALAIAFTSINRLSAQTGSASPAGRTITKPPITALAISPNGKSLVVGSQAGLERRSWPALSRVKNIATELAHIHDLAFSPDGNLLAAAGGAPAESGAVEVYRWPSLELAYRCEPHTDVVYAVAWRADSSRFAAASADTDVTEHDAATGKEIRRLQGHSRPVLTACYLPDGKHLITAGIDETLRIWNRQGEIERTLSNHTAAVNQAALRPSTEPQAQPVIASAGDDRTVRIWQPAVGRLMRFVRLDHIPNAIAWSADGAKIFAACSDGRVRTIDSETAEVQSTLDAIDGVAYSIAVAPDGRLAVGGSNGQVQRLASPAITLQHSAGNSD